MYNLTDHLTHLESKHWPQIGFMKLKKLSLCVLPCDQNHLNNIQLENNNFDKFILDNMADNHLYGEEMSVLKNLKTEISQNYNLCEKRKTYSLPTQRVDCSHFILNLNSKLINSLVFKHDTYISNDAFIKIMTDLNLNDLKISRVNLSHIDAVDIKTIFTRGVTLPHIQLRQCSLIKSVIVEFLDSLSLGHHSIKN